jgi:hypothetical protein
MHAHTHTQNPVIPMAFPLYSVMYILPQYFVADFCNMTIQFLYLFPQKAFKKCRMKSFTRYASKALVLTCVNITQGALLYLNPIQSESVGVRLRLQVVAIQLFLVPLSSQLVPSRGEEKWPFLTEVF